MATRFRALLQAEMLPIVFGAAAFLVGIAGEVLLFKDRWRTVGAIALGLSALMGALAWRRVRDKLVADATPTAALVTSRLCERILLINRLLM